MTTLIAHEAGPVRPDDSQGCSRCGLMLASSSSWAVNASNETIPATKPEGSGWAPVPVGTVIDGDVTYVPCDALTARRSCE